MEFLLGIDIGTNSSKGALVNKTGEIAATWTVEHELEISRPGWAEHDAETTWWHDFLEITRRSFTPVASARSKSPESG